MALLAALPAGCIDPLRDPLRGEPPAEAARHGTGGEAECLAFSPDGRYLAVGTAWRTSHPAGHWKGSVVVYDLAADTEVANLAQPRWVHALAFSPDGKYLAVGCGVNKTADEPPTDPPYQESPGELAVYATAGFREAFRWTARQVPSEVRGVAFHPRGTAVYAVVTPEAHHAFKPGEVRSWSVPGFQAGWAADRPQGQYTGLAAAGDKLLVADRGPPGDSKHLVRVFAADTGRHRADVPGGLQVTASADGRLAVVLTPSSCALMDPGNEVPIPAPAFPDPAGQGVRVSAAALSADGGRVALTGRAGDHRYHVGVWDLGTGAKAYWEEDRVRYAALAFSPDGALLAACGPGSEHGKGRLVVWQVPALK